MRFLPPFKILNCCHDINSLDIDTVLWHMFGGRSSLHQTDNITAIFTHFKLIRNVVSNSCLPLGFGATVVTPTEVTPGVGGGLVDGRMTSGVSTASTTTPSTATPTSVPDNTLVARRNKAVYGEYQFLVFR